MRRRSNDRIDLFTAATRSAVVFAVDRVCGLLRLGVMVER